MTVTMRRMMKMRRNPLPGGRTEARMEARLGATYPERTRQAKVRQEESLWFVRIGLLGHEEVPRGHVVVNVSLRTENKRYLLLERRRK